MFRILARVVSWFGPLKKRILLGSFYSFVLGVFLALPIVLAAVALAKVLEQHRGGAPVIARDVWIFTLLMLLAVAGRFVFTYLKARTQDTCGYERIGQARIEFGDVLKRVPLGYFQQHTKGELLGAITSDLSFMEMHLMNMVDAVISGYITTIVMVISLTVVDPWFGAISLTGLVLSHLALRRLEICSSHNVPIRQQAQDSMIASTLEFLRGIAVVKSFNQQGASYEALQRSFTDSRKINIQIETQFVRWNAAHLIALQAASVGVVAYSSWLGYIGRISQPSMVMVDIFAFVMFLSAQGLNNAVHVLRVLDGTLDKLETISNAEPIDRDGRDIAIADHSVVFENVSFAYDETPALRDVSFTIPAGKTTAIVGPSGSGKSTICNLLARFYDVNEGRILLSGHDLREFTCNSVLDNLSMVFQDIYLFNDTVANNIRFGRPEATDAEIVEAAEAACCHEMILGLPDGYQTVLSEGGQSLSGGERQRLSIARCLLKDAPIVVLDEATASIDPENEHLIQTAISNLVAGRTVAVVAHRLATIEQADQILVMSDGQVVESGTHQELVSADGVYCRFVELRRQAVSWTIGQS